MLFLSNSHKPVILTGFQDDVLWLLGDAGKAPFRICMWGFWDGRGGHPKGCTADPSASLGMTKRRGAF
jgi:hypothetical protein